MMSWADIYEEAITLPIEEKVFLIEALTRDMTASINDLRVNYNNAKVAMELARGLNNGKDEDIENLLKEN